MQRELLVSVMVRRGGFRKALRALSYVVAWGIVARELGHDPTWEQYEAYWKQSRSTTARESKAFFACVPDGVKVADVWHSIERSVSVGNRDEMLADVLQAPWKVAA